jgi:addiction module HigA family antidote
MSRLSIIIEERVMPRFAFEQVHPGAVLKEELEARGLSANAFALKLRVPPQRIQDIVAGRRGISPDTALRLEASLGTPARLWLDMQSGYDLYWAEKKVGAAVKRDVLAA